MVRFLVYLLLLSLLFVNFHLLIILELSNSTELRLLEEKVHSVYEFLDLNVAKICSNTVIFSSFDMLFFLIFLFLLYLFTRNFFNFCFIAEVLVLNFQWNQYLNWWMQCKINNNFTSISNFSFMNVNCPRVSKILDVYCF